MLKAYGSALINSEGEIPSSPWYSQWKQLIQHSGNLHVLPGGAAGHHYVDLLELEMRHLAVGNFPSEVVTSILLCDNAAQSYGEDN